MTDRKIRVSFSFTKNLGNYESCKVDMGVERDVHPEESFEDALRSEYDLVLNEVLDASGIAKKKIKQK
jgi:hypothetical protein